MNKVLHSNDGDHYKPQQHLINILTGATGRSKFVLFLGAGASVCSGIKPSRDMIDGWREKFCNEQKPVGISREDFLKTFSWYNTDEEYSTLFEALFDEPSQRREYIEECVKGASPSWGYIYLVNLLRKNIFNTVFTTNFDDLLNEACYLFSDEVRPIVCAHDSSIRAIRITSDRPKIIKLHGDFLFDNIKNTVSELETLENNMRDKFRQYATEFGLVVIGYGGCDRSVMDTIALLLQSERCFPYGVYWCTRKGAGLSRKAQLLLKYPRFKTIEIEGFDEFVAQLHSDLGHDLQPELSDPYGALGKRLNNLMRNTYTLDGQAHPIIARDIAEIGKKISSISASIPALSGDAKLPPHFEFDMGSTKLSVELPFGLLAKVREDEGRTEEAIGLMVKQLKQNANAQDFRYAVMLAGKAQDKEKLKEIIDLLEVKKEVFKANPFAITDMGLELVRAKAYAEADRVFDIGYSTYALGDLKNEYFVRANQMNKIQIKVHQGIALEEAEIEFLRKCQEEQDPLVRYGASVLLGEYKRAEETLMKALPENPHIVTQVQDWPITSLLRPHLTEETLKRQMEKPRSSAVVPGSMRVSTKKVGVQKT